MILHGTVQRLALTSKNMGVLEAETVAVDALQYERPKHSWHASSYFRLPVIE